MHIKAIIVCIDEYYWSIILSRNANVQMKVRNKYWQQSADFKVYIASGTYLAQGEGHLTEYSH